MLSPEHALIVVPPGPSGDESLMRVFRTDGAEWLPVPTRLRGYLGTIENWYTRELAATSANGRYLAIGWNHDGPRDLLVAVYDVIDWVAVKRFTVPNPPGGFGSYNGIAVSDAGLVAVSSTDNPASGIYGVRIFDPADEDPVAGEQIAVTPVAPPSGRGVFMPGGLFGVPTHSGFTVFDASSWIEVSAPVISVPPGAQYSARSTDGSRLLLINNNFSNGGVYLFDWATGNEIALPASPKSVEFSAFSGDGKKIFYGSSSSNIVRMMDVDAVTDTQVLTVAQNIVNIALSPDGGKLAVHAGGFPQTVSIYDTGAWAVESVMQVHTNTQSAGASSAEQARHMAWTPLPSLKTVTGTVRDADDAPAVRDVQVLSRTDDAFSVRATSDANGQYKVWVAVGGEQVNRIVYDSTGSQNDLIDRVEL